MIVRRRDHLLRIWRSQRSALLVSLAVSLGVASLFELYQWRRSVSANDIIDGLRAGRNIEIGPDALPEALLARIAYLTTRGELDQARTLVEALDRRGEAGSLARGHYLLGNALLRRALAHIEKSELDAAGPYVNLAKREYRRTLQLDPYFWDAKFNFDVAARLVRDFPDFERKGGDELSADPKKLWTDIPGKPKGLP